MKKRLPPIVEIEWLDTMSTSGWQTKDDRLRQTKIEDMDHRSIGYLLKRGPEYVVVAQSVGEQHDNVGDTLMIPRQAVKKVTVLRK